jgi:hypothetical protein
VTFTPGTRFVMYSAAMVALGWPTSFDLQNAFVDKIQENEEKLNTPEKKLSIEIANVDCVHIDDMYILET